MNLEAEDMGEDLDGLWNNLPVNEFETLPEKEQNRLVAEFLSRKQGRDADEYMATAIAEELMPRYSRYRDMITQALADNDEALLGRLVARIFRDNIGKCIQEEWDSK